MMRPYPIGNGTLEPVVPREFAAIMDALQLRGPSTDALLQLERKEWERLLDFCDLAHLTLALAQASCSDFPAWVVRRLSQNVADNAHRYERVRATYSEVAEVLRNIDVPHVVLKGFTQSPDYVRNPRYRVQADVDLYLRSSDLERAQKALEQIGYSPDEGVDYQYADHVPTLSRRGPWKWNGNMYDPDMPASIELHFCLWNEQSTLIGIPEFEAFWERRVPRTIDGAHLPTLSPVDQLAYFALHIVRGIFSGDWVVHHVRELAVFLNDHADDDRFWAEWHSVHSSRLRSLEAIAFWMAEACFSCAIHPSIRRSIESIAKPQKEWLERYGSSALEVMFRRNKDGRLLQFLLIESWRSRQQVFRRAILPASLAGIVRPKLKIRNRRDLASIYDNRSLAYLAHLGDRVASNLYANTRLLSRGACLWLLRHQFRAQFLLFLGASFFLTWDSPHTFSSSIFS